MMYLNKFVAAIKVNGRVLREHGDTVYLPFGSEYSILLKNLSTVRAQVKIMIDGTDVLNGDSLVVNPGDLELERFLKELDRGNRFKFIERTKAVENHKGIGAEDGLVRIEYQFEKIRVPRYGGAGGSGMSLTRRFKAGELPEKGFYGNATMFSSSTYTSVPLNETGITAPGSISDQRFQSVADFELEDQKHVLIFRLLGEVPGKVVQKPVTVKHKPTCISCGKVNQAASKFCSECGTGLEVV
jgi:hypothetical protein